MIPEPRTAPAVALDTGPARCRRIRAGERLLAALLDSRLLLGGRLVRRHPGRAVLVGLVLLAVLLHVCPPRGAVASSGGSPVAGPRTDVPRSARAGRWG